MQSFPSGIAWLTQSFTFPPSQLPTKKPIVFESKIVLFLSMSNVAALSKVGNLVDLVVVSVAVDTPGNNLCGRVSAHHLVLVFKEVDSEAASAVAVEDSEAAFVVTEEVALAIEAGSVVATEEDLGVIEEVDLVIVEDSAAEAGLDIKEGEVLEDEVGIQMELLHQTHPAAQVVVVGDLEVSPMVLLNLTTLIVVAMAMVTEMAIEGEVLVAAQGMRAETPEAVAEVIANPLPVETEDTVGIETEIEKGTETVTATGMVVAAAPAPAGETKTTDRENDTTKVMGMTTREAKGGTKLPPPFTRLDSLLSTRRNKKHSTVCWWVPITSFRISRLLSPTSRLRVRKVLDGWKTTSPVQGFRLDHSLSMAILSYNLPSLQLVRWMIDNRIGESRRLAKHISPLVEPLLPQSRVLVSASQPAMEFIDLAIGHAMLATQWCPLHFAIQLSSAHRLCLNLPSYSLHFASPGFTSLLPLRPPATALACLPLWLSGRVAGWLTV